MKKAIYFLSIISLMAIGCSKKEAQETTQKTADVFKVKTELAQSQEIDRIYEFSTTVEAAVKNYITSAGGTRIEKIMVEVGDVVKKGQQLVKMESTQLTTTLAQLDNLKIELERIKTLYQSGGVSKQQLDQTNANAIRCCKEKCRKSKRQYLPYISNQRNCYSKKL